MKGPATRTRRTQEERSALTRARLIEATLDCLMEHGWTRTTTADIADRAGVSRGALTHHFESKEELVGQSVEHLLADATRAIGELAGSVRDGPLDFDVFLDRLWEMFSGRLFYVTLEHVTEARHNTNLKARLVPVVRDFHRALDEIWRTFFGASGLSDGEIETTLNATLCLLRGMGVQTVLREDPAYYARLIAWWKGEMRRLVSVAGDRSGPRIRII
jgi:AcrR family transcriptional regulator